MSASSKDTQANMPKSAIPYGVCRECGKPCIAITEGGLANILVTVKCEDEHLTYVSLVGEWEGAYTGINFQPFQGWNVNVTEAPEDAWVYARWYTGNVEDFRYVHAILRRNEKRPLFGRWFDMRGRAYGKPDEYARIEGKDCPGAFPPEDGVNDPYSRQRHLDDLLALERDRKAEVERCTPRLGDVWCDPKTLTTYRVTWVRSDDDKNDAYVLCAKPGPPGRYGAVFSEHVWREWARGAVMVTRLPE